MNESFQTHKCTVTCDAASSVKIQGWTYCVKFPLERREHRRSLCNSCFIYSYAVRAHCIKETLVPERQKLFHVAPLAAPYRVLLETQHLEMVTWFGWGNGVAVGNLEKRAREGHIHCPLLLSTNVPARSVAQIRLPPPSNHLPTLMLRMAFRCTPRSLKIRRLSLPQLSSVIAFQISNWQSF